MGIAAAATATAQSCFTGRGRRKRVDGSLFREIPIHPKRNRGLNRAPGAVAATDAVLRKSFRMSLHLAVFVISEKLSSGNV